MASSTPGDDDIFSSNGTQIKALNTWNFRDPTHEIAYKEHTCGEHERLSAGGTYLYPPQAKRKLLIEYCTNEWERNPQYTHEVGPYTLADRFEDCLDNYINFWLAVFQSRKFRRLFIVVACTFITAVGLWIAILGPYVAENQAAAASLNIDAAKGLFGTNIRPHFPGMIHVRNLDPKYLPRGTTSRLTNARDRRRLVFIGDIHGCKKELCTLLERVKFNPDRDHI